VFREFNGFNTVDVIEICYDDMSSFSRGKQAGGASDAGTATSYKCNFSV
jgi:hypothetical protein